MKTSEVNTILFAVLLVGYVCRVVSSNDCPENQSGYVGQEGTINCVFESGFAGVYWYDASDDDNPMIRLESRRVIGRGYDSGEYNISPDGSLIINTVTEQHDMIYRVLVLDVQYRDSTFRVAFKPMEGCPVNQNGSVGSSAIIKCYFNPRFVAVYWYDEAYPDQPFIRLEQGLRIGRGYDDHHYNISNDGSLIIHRVNNDMIYKVMVLGADYASLEQNVNFQPVNYCPPKQNGLLGEAGIVVCHIKPNFARVIWYEITDVEKPLLELRREIRTGEGYGNKEYKISNNGSLIIRRVMRCSDIVYKILVIDANNDTFTGNVTFKPIAFCSCHLPIDNGHVNMSAKYAQFWCNKGFDLLGEIHLDCNNNNSRPTSRYSWNGEPPRCVSNTTTSTLVPQSTTHVDVTTTVVATMTNHPNRIPDSITNANNGNYSNEIDQPKPPRGNLDTESKARPLHPTIVLIVIGLILLIISS